MPVPAAPSSVSVIGFASTAARVLFGLVAGRVGVVLAYKATTVTIWASFLIWLPSRSYWVLLVFALVFGAGYGGNIALMPAMLGHYYGVDSLGTVTGVMFTTRESAPAGMVSVLNPCEPVPGAGVMA